MLAQAEITSYMEETWQHADLMDEREEEFATVRRRLTSPPQSQRHMAERMRRAYEEATGMSLGCD